MNSRLSNAIGVVVTAAWSISFLADIVIKGYDPPSTVHALMMIVVGAAFTGPLVSKTREAKVDAKNHEEAKG